MSALQMVEHILENNRLTAELLGQFFTAFKGSGYESTLDAIVDEMLGRQLSHFSGSDQHHCLVRKVVEYLLRQFHRRKCHGNGGRSNVRFGPHPFRDGKRFVQEAVQDDSDVWYSRRNHRRSSLAEYLGFTHHHGIETRRNPEDVANGCFSVQSIKVLIQHVEGEIVVIRKEPLYPPMPPAMS
jgi:hypothetical protein